METDLRVTQKRILKDEAIGHSNDASPLSGEGQISKNDEMTYLVVHFPLYISAAFFYSGWNQRDGPSH